MKKEWFVIIDGQREGPYTPADLKIHFKVTPDTLAWKEGFKEWVAIRFIPELKFIFEDETSGQPIKDEEFKAPVDTGSDEATLTLRRDPFQFLLLIVLLIILLIYLVFH